MGAATSLEGKPAPDFTLTAIDGSTVSLADLKGSVAVLDFWATWCGPCVESLPHIDQIHADLSDKGLKVYAVNLQEQKAQVQKFLTSKKLTLPVLLDSDGATAKKYLANAIPETVIIGKDGIVQKVFVGFGGDEPVRDAIDAAMKK
jgi:peroxiredoxin